MKSYTLVEGRGSWPVYFDKYNLFEEKSDWLCCVDEELSESSH